MYQTAKDGKGVVPQTIRCAIFQGGNTEIMERIVQLALKRAEMVSTLPMPGRALAVVDV
jgi:hypothetical protein